MYMYENLLTDHHEEPIEVLITYSLRVKVDMLY